MRTARLITICACIIAIRRVTVVGYAIDGYAGSRDSRSSYSNSEQQTEEAANVNKQVVVLVPLDRDTDVDGRNGVNVKSIIHPGHKTKRCKSLTPLRKTRLSTTLKEVNGSKSHYVVEPTEDRRMVLMKKLPRQPANVDGSGENGAPLEGDEVVFMDSRSAEDQRRKKYVCYCMEEGCGADHPRRPLSSAAKKRLNSKLLKNKKCTPCQTNDPTKIPIPIGHPQPPVAPNPFQSAQGYQPYQNLPHESYVGYSPLQSLIAASQQRTLGQSHNVVYDDSFISPSRQDLPSSLVECVRLHGLDYCLSQATSAPARYPGGYYQHQSDVEEGPVGSQWNQQASTESANVGGSNLNFYSTDFTSDNCEHGASVGQQHSHVYPPYQQIPIIDPKYLGYDEVYGNYNHAAAGVTPSPLITSGYVGYHDGRYDNYLDDRAQTGVVDSSTEYIIREPEVPETVANPASTSDDYEDDIQQENQLGKSSSDCYTGAIAAPAPAEPLPGSQPGQVLPENFEYSITSEAPVTSSVELVGAQPSATESYDWETTPMHEESDYDAATETAESAVVRSSGEFTEAAPPGELVLQPESTYHSADVPTEQPPAADLGAPLTDILQGEVLPKEVVSGDVDDDNVVGGTVSEPAASVEDISEEVDKIPEENASVSYDEYPQGSSEEIMATSEPGADYDVLRNDLLGASAEEDHGDDSLPVAAAGEPVDVPEEVTVSEAPALAAPIPQQPEPKEPLDVSPHISSPEEALGAAPTPQEAAGAPADSTILIPEASIPTSDEAVDASMESVVPADYASPEEGADYAAPEYVDSEEPLSAPEGSTPAAANVPFDYEDVAAPADYPIDDYAVASVEQVSSETPVEEPAYDSEELASPAEPQEPVISVEYVASQSPVAQPELPLPSSEYSGGPQEAQPVESQQAPVPIVCAVPSISDEKYLSELQALTGLAMEDNKLLRAAVYQAITELASNAEQHLQATRTFSCDIVGAPEPALIQGLGDLPIIRELFNVPLVRQLAVGTVRDILTQLTGVAKGSSLAKLGNTVIDAALRTVIGGGEPLGDVEEAQLGIVNENVASVPDIILSIISSIISRPAIGIQGARNPGIQNIIVNTLANLINRARHLVDNSIIWDALHNVIENGIHRVPTAPVLPKPSAPVLPKPSAPVRPKPPGPAPIVEPSGGDTKPLPYIPVTEHFIQDGEWYEGPATVGYKGEFPEPKGPAATVSAGEPEQPENASEEPIRYHSPEDIVLTYIKNHPADQGHELGGPPEEDESPTTMHHLNVNVEPVTEEYTGEDYDASEAPPCSQETIRLPALGQSHEVTTERVHKSYTKTRKYYSFSGRNKPTQPDALPSLGSLGGCSGEKALGSPGSDPTYLGRLTSDFGSDVNGIEDLEGSDLYYVGDGVRLPLTIKRMSDGSFALSLSDRVCENYVKENCPCCVPKLGHVVRETTVEEDNGNTRVSSQKQVHSRGVRSTTTAAEEVTDNPEEGATVTAMPVQKFVRKYNLTLNTNHSHRHHQKTPSASTLTAEPARSGVNIVLGFRDAPEVPDTLEENRYIQDLLSIHDIPEQQRAAVVINALDGLLNDPADDWSNQKSSESGTKPPGFEYQLDNPIMERIKRLKNGQLEHGGYKYQQHPDEAARVRTEAAKNILHWLKELILKTQAAEIS